MMFNIVDVILFIYSRLVFGLGKYIKVIILISKMYYIYRLDDDIE